MQRKRRAEAASINLKHKRQRKRTKVDDPPLSPIARTPSPPRRARRSSRASKTLHHRDAALNAQLQAALEAQLQEKERGEAEEEEETKCVVPSTPFSERIAAFQSEAASAVHDFDFAPAEAKAITELREALSVQSAITQDKFYHNPCTKSFSIDPWPRTVASSGGGGVGGLVLFAKAGLGKTRIAAKTIAKQLLGVSQQPQNILVVCPDALVTQWRDELRAHITSEHHEPLVVTDGVSYNRLRVNKARLEKGVVLILAASFINKPCYRSYASLRRESGESRDNAKEAWVTLHKLEQVMRGLEQGNGITQTHLTVRFAMACGILEMHMAQALGSALKNQCFKRDPRIVIRLATAIKSATLIPSASTFERGVWEANFEALVDECIDIEKFPWTLAILDEPFNGNGGVGAVLSLSPDFKRKHAMRDAFANFTCKKLVLSRPLLRKDFGAKQLLLELIGVKVATSDSLWTDLKTLFEADATTINRFVCSTLLSAFSVDCSKLPEAQAITSHIQSWAHATTTTEVLEPDKNIDVPVSVELADGPTAAQIAADQRRTEHGLITIDQKTFIAIVEDTADKLRAESLAAVKRDVQYLSDYQSVLTQQLDVLKGLGALPPLLPPEVVLMQLALLDDLDLTVDQLCKRISSNKHAAERTINRDALQLYVAHFGKVAREQMQCVVCQDASVTDLLLTCCAHTFCDSCLQAWRTSGEPRADSCPVCREHVFAVCPVTATNEEEDPTTFKELTYNLTKQNYGAKIAWLERELQTALECAPVACNVLVVCWCERSAQSVAAALRKTCGWHVQRVVSQAQHECIISVINASAQVSSVDAPHVDWLVMMSDEPPISCDPKEWVLRAKRTKPVRITTLKLNHS